MVEGKKRANMWMKEPSAPRQAGFKFEIKMSPGYEQENSLNYKYM